MLISKSEEAKQREYSATSSGASAHFLSSVREAQHVGLNCFLLAYDLAEHDGLMGREPYRIMCSRRPLPARPKPYKSSSLPLVTRFTLPPISRSARGFAKAIEFDVLLSDLRLPDGTGWDLMEELSATKPIRAIAISGHNTDTDIERSRKVGLRPHCQTASRRRTHCRDERAVTKPRRAAARH